MKRPDAVGVAFVRPGVPRRRACDARVRDPARRPACGRGDARGARDALHVARGADGPQRVRLRRAPGGRGRSYRRVFTGEESRTGKASPRAMRQMLGPGAGHATPFAAGGPGWATAGREPRSAPSRRHWRAGACREVVCLVSDGVLPPASPLPARLRAGDLAPAAVIPAGLASALGFLTSPLLRNTSAQIVGGAPRGLRPTGGPM